MVFKIACGIFRWWHNAASVILFPLPLAPLSIPFPLLLSVSVSHSYILVCARGSAICTLYTLCKES